MEPLNESPHWYEAVRIERELVNSIQNNLSKSQIINHGDKQLNNLADCALLPSELMRYNIKKNLNNKMKTDSLKCIKELPNEDVEDEEDQEDEEDEDEEQNQEDEEDDAGGDYLVSHFDNGEGFDDNEDEADEMTSMI